MVNIAMPSQVMSMLEPFLVRALVGALLTSIIAATSGTFSVLRGLSFLVSGVAHAAFGGVALGIFLQEVIGVKWFHPLLGALLFAAIVAVGAGYAGEGGFTARMEAAIGVIFAFSMSLAVLIMFYLPAEKIPLIWGFLFGDILLLTNEDLFLLGAMTSLMIGFTIVFHREFTYIIFDPETAEAYGMRSRAYHYLLLVLSALAIAAATKAVGAILVYAVIVIPAATSALVGRSIPSIALRVFLIAICCQYLGLAASAVFQAAPSAVAGVLAALIYLIILLAKRRGQ